ncbi:MarR family winged helix-turn-helix transcriptional regulator [Actinocatenispora rupis]|uniref:Putative transcriptional regulator, MarR family protein n=1 Tax=Actinocatenispora rupis TaxID=519421 RepID=A0A8J3NGB8_9ACTN|nr:MarR family transcriptional regulator [Actinocatenispora rupis]GID16252.1 putative transcriptional regulator, MarR family protein [Actinocatenispora rupis]
MAEPTRPDLAAMIVPLGRSLMAAEQPILAAHDLTMWEYVVLTALSTEPVRTQAALADAVGADKTRIIPVLDGLQRRGLLTREPDPADRRVRLLALTPQGRRLRDTTRTAIQRNEERVLRLLPAADRRVLLRALRTLADLPRDTFLPET